MEEELTARQLTKTRGRPWAAAGIAVLVVTLAAAAVALSTGGSHAGAAVKQTPVHGGVLRISYKTDVSTLDPATCYDQQCFEAVPLVFQGLYDYDRKGNIIPQIAAGMPKITGGGRIYTIKLRSDVKFSNGRSVTAADFVYGVRRLLAPKTATPVISFWTNLKGADAYFKGKTTSLPGVRALNAHTVRLRLNSPQKVFINILAMTGSFLVPKEVADKEGKNFGHKPVGTGPFIVKSWVPGQQITFVRNPNYWKKSTPYLNEVDYVLGLEPDVALLRLKSGQLDLLGDGVPPADYPNLVSDPTWSRNINKGKVFGMIYLSMNTQHAPLSDRRVRQAIAYTIDREKIIKLTAGRGTIADHYYVPGIPGQAKNAPIYRVNIAKAKTLMKAAGVSNVTLPLIVRNVEPFTTIAQSIQQDLSQIGIKMTIRSMPIADTYSAEGKASYNGFGLNDWYADFPDPWDLINSFLTSQSAVDGGINFAFYKNPSVDKLNAAAAVEANVAKRTAMYAQVEKILLTDMPWLPLYYPYEIDLHSPQLHMFTNPIWVYSFENYWKSAK
jgi:ABC-type oligopeptide transport system substrate-binding subunit